MARAMALAAMSRAAAPRATATWIAWLSPLRELTLVTYEGTLSVAFPLALS
jgi:hypothetical protein